MDILSKLVKNELVKGLPHIALKKKRSYVMIAKLVNKLKYLLKARITFLPKDLYN